MPLLKEPLAAGILVLLTDMRTKPVVSDAYFAAQLATLIDTYVKSAVVVGTCVNIAGPGTIVGTLQ